MTTGISAADRAHTIRTAIDRGANYTDLARPGHVFPLRARKGGVLVRAGQTEASVDLARMAGLNPSGVICEIMRDDGEMARIPDLIPFCKEHGLRILTVAELIRYRLRHERYIVRAGESRIQTRYGEFRMIAYESQVNGGESHIALVRGDLCADCPAFHTGPAVGYLPEAPGSSEYGERQLRPPCEHPVLVRVHTRCTAGDLFAADCHCREILDQSMRMIAERVAARCFICTTPRGALRSTARRLRRAPSSRTAQRLCRQRATRRSAGWFCTANCGRAKARRPAQGAFCAPSDWAARSSPTWASGASACLSNTPMHIPALEGFGLEIVEQVAIPVEECSSDSVDRRSYGRAFWQLT